MQEMCRGESGFTVVAKGIDNVSLDLNIDDVRRDV